MKSSAAVIVLDHVPSDDEVEEIAMTQLEEFDCEFATAVPEILTSAPSWMDIAEKDQINAHLRDSVRKKACVLVIYMQESEDAPESDEYLEDDEDV